MSWSELLKLLQLFSHFCGILSRFCVFEIFVSGLIGNIYGVSDHQFLLSAEHSQHTFPHLVSLYCFSNSVLCMQEYLTMITWSTVRDFVILSLSAVQCSSDRWKFGAQCIEWVTCYTGPSADFRRTNAK